MNIVVNNLCHIFPDGTSIFSDVSFSIEAKSKCALVGANGCGKSLLMSILSGREKPAGGEVFLGDSPYLVPQHFAQFNSMTVAEVLRVKDKIEALNAILSGDAEETDFSILDDDWSIEERVRSALEVWGLTHVSLDTCMSSLSGGEKTKVFLAGIMIHNPQIILMDEPSNHLDEETRTKLYDFIDTVQSTVLVVSHDVMLLNRFFVIYELSAKGICRYTMRFDEYRAYIENENRVQTENVDRLRKDLRKEKLIAREATARQQKHNSRGQRHTEKKCVARIAMGNMKNRAENSTAKLTGMHQAKIDRLTESVAEASSMIYDISRMKVDLSSSDAHTGKVQIEMQGVNFAYSGKCDLWASPLDFVVRSGDRIRVIGGNGSGKSTLMKIIMGHESPSRGRVLSSDDLRCLYLDQEYSLIDNGVTVSEQIQIYNRNSLPEHELNIRLNRFLFPKSTWGKSCAVLSGGEKMRLSLCCLMVSENAPDIIIADEPTNNLDLYNTMIR